LDISRLALLDRDRHKCGVSTTTTVRTAHQQHHPLPPTAATAAPQAYVELAKDCMRGVSERRPTFDQIVARLQAMLGQQDELQAEAEAGAANAAAAAAAQETPVAEDGWRRVA
jgi:hypothetical protein